MTIQIRDYQPNDPNDAERVAAMFNDFDSAWPGGFTRGDVETGERTRERKGRMRRLAILVAEDTETGDFVGYCDLDAQPGQKEFAYIDLLGARLSVHGKGVGKALLLEAIRRVVEAGYREVTLNTWAGNTKAVPLYKKTGFQWVPDTDVYMRNLIPSALAVPVVRALIGDRDWYALHERELTTAPDDVTWRGMKIFSYRFRHGDEFVQLAFQADSGGLTSLETPDFAVSCTVPVEEAAAGCAYPIVWEIEPRRRKTIEAVLTAQGDSGLEIDLNERIATSQPIKIARELCVAANAGPRRAGERTHLVRSTLLIDGQTVTLETGVKVVRPIEIHYGGQGVSVGRRERVIVKLRNRLENAVAGTLALENHPAIDCPQPAQPFHIPAHSWSQCVFDVKAIRPGVHQTALRYTAELSSAGTPADPQCTWEGAAVSTTLPPRLQNGRPATFRAFAGSEAHATIDANDERAILESLDVRVAIELRGGHTEVWRSGGKSSVLAGNTQLGPPFGSTRMRPPLYTAQVITEDGVTKLRIHAPSVQVAGITLERLFSIQGDGLVRIEQRVSNASGHPQPAQIRVRMHTEFNEYLAAPLPGGLIREPLRSLHEFPAGDTDLFERGAQLTENWIAMEGDGEVSGIVWEGEPAQERDWSLLPMLTYDLGIVPPHSAVDAPTYWLAAAHGDWKVVRSAWKRLAAPQGVEEQCQPVPSRILKLTSDPAPILMRRDREEAVIVLESRRGMAINGTMELIGKGLSGDPSAFSLTSVNRDNPMRAGLTLTTASGPAAGILTAKLNLGAQSELLELPIVHAGSGADVAISETGPNEVVIDNGYMTLRFATDFPGALRSLETEGANHILSAWPEAKPFVWMNPWCGGVHPFLGWMGNPELARELFTGQVIERTGERGWRWRGVGTSCDLSHKDRSWLRVELDYLTLPGSNLIALVLRCTNGSTARMVRTCGVAAWAQPGGSREQSVLHWERHGEQRTRRRSGFAAEGESGKWAAVENAATRDALFLVAAHPAHSASWEDFGEEGPHIQVRGPVELEPNETREFVYWLVHSREASQAAAYGLALSQAVRLP